MTANDAHILTQIPRRFRSRWLAGYSRGKLQSDPLYRAAFTHLGASSLPLLDIGCGTGLLAFYLRERGYQAPILGLDVDERKIAAGQEIAAEHYPTVELRLGDGVHLPEFSGHIALLDVLQYLTPPEQSPLLHAMAARVAPGGWCLIRTTPRDSSWRFRITEVAEWFTGSVAWNRRRHLSFPPLEQIAAHFPEDIFTRKIGPLWGRTPFNSWLLAFQRK